MTKFISIISAKGGVGRTTAAINVASALHKLGRNAMVVDAHLHQPDVGMRLGLTWAHKTIHSALRGDHPLHESVYRMQNGLLVIPGSIAYHDTMNAKRDNLMESLHSLKGSAEAILIDSAPGLAEDAKTAIRASDYMIAVSTLDLPCATATLRMIKYARENHVKVLGVIANRHKGRAYEMNPHNLTEFLSIPLLGVVPEDDCVPLSSHKKQTIMDYSPNNDTGSAFKCIAGRLISGKSYKSTAKAPPEIPFNPWKPLNNR